MTNATFFFPYVPVGEDVCEEEEAWETLYVPKNIDEDYRPQKHQCER